MHIGHIGAWQVAEIKLCDIILDTLCVVCS